MGPADQSPGVHDPLELGFCSDIFSIETIKKVAYRFAGVGAVNISAPPGVVLFRLVPSKPLTPNERFELEAAIRREAIDQDLRTTVAKETADYRNLILALAFSKTGLQSE